VWLQDIKHLKAQGTCALKDFVFVRLKLDLYDRDHFGQRIQAVIQGITSQYWHIFRYLKNHSTYPSQTTVGLSSTGKPTQFLIQEHPQGQHTPKHHQTFGRVTRGIPLTTTKEPSNIYFRRVWQSSTNSTGDQLGNTKNPLSLTVRWVTPK